MVWAESSSLLAATARWGNSLLALISQVLHKSSVLGGNDDLQHNMVAGYV